MNKARFEAFSEGVFAFAITLLSLIRGDGRRAPATAVDFSTSYAMRASASACQKHPRWHHHWHHGTRGLGSRSGQPQEH
jgi:hypothetical protein